MNGGLVMLVLLVVPALALIMLVETVESGEFSVNKVQGSVVCFESCDCWAST